MRHIPPPYAGPLIAAMIGCGIWRIAGTTSLMYDIERIARREKPRSWVFGGMPRSWRSSPEQNARPAPVSTATQQSLSRPTSASAS